MSFQFSFFSLCVGVTVFGNELRFLFCLQLHVLGDFVFCFDYISIWHCISNQRLVPCNRLDALQDPPSWDTSSPHDRCHHDAPTVARFPLTGTALGPRRVVYSTSHATGKPNRIDSTLPVRRGHTSQGQDGCSPKDGHLFGGMWGSLRSDTLCYFVAPRAPMQFLGDNGEDTTHSYKYNRHTCKHMHTHTLTQSITRKQQTHETGNRDSAGVTGVGAVCGDTGGTSPRFFKNRENRCSLRRGRRPQKQTTAVQLWQWQRGQRGGRQKRKNKHYPRNPS